MWKRYCISVLFLLLSSGLLSPALAHPPYFGQTKSIDHPDFGTATLSVLYGDGVFFSDPARVVVFDTDGRLLAATRLSSQLTIFCDDQHRSTHCFVYDGARGLILEPDFDTWKPGMLITEGGQTPIAYPDYMDIDIAIDQGFSQRPPSFVERASIEAEGVLNAPFTTFLAVVWWVLAWSSITHLLWALKFHGWNIFPVSVWSVLSAILNIFVFVLMSLLTAYGWILQPYSFIYLLFVCITGLLMAAILTRRRPVVRAS